MTGPTAADDEDVYTLDLHPDTEAVGQARRGVRATLARWHLTQIVDACQLAVSELVTNAVTHGQAPVGLTLRHRDAEVRLDVHDGDPSEPRSAHKNIPESLDAESGRGWDIVQAVSDNSGVEQIPDDGKKVFASWRVTDRHEP